MARGADAADLVVTHRCPTLTVEPVTAEASEMYLFGRTTRGPGTRCHVRGFPVPRARSQSRMIRAAWSGTVVSVSTMRSATCS